MQPLKNNNAAAYRKLTQALKKRGSKISPERFQKVTTADVVAATALPLAEVRELLPQAALEYSARLEVTESGEILYSFPRGFVSRYRGFKVSLKKYASAFFKKIRLFGVLLFKVWIMVMLVGYFALFMLLALASLMLSAAAAGSSRSNSRSSSRDAGGFYFVSHIFDLIIRLWFYSALTKSAEERYYGRSRQARPQGRPLHKAIFSFIFGDGDPNKDWDEKQNKALIAFIQSHKGVISQPEFMTVTGLPSQQAERALIACCCRFGGSPEASEEGTIVYRFDDLLLRADKTDRSFSSVSPPIKRLRTFSSNKKTMNTWFGLINTVNLLFGSYFFVNALRLAPVITPDNLIPGNLYAISYHLFAVITRNPLPVMGVGLGIVPLVFSVLFWLIPALRFLGEKKENENIKLANLRKLGFGRIWADPRTVRDSDMDMDISECRPRKFAAARSQVIKDMGAYSVPDVQMDDSGAVIYDFKELKREKDVLETYRTKIDLKPDSIGKTVFDSDG
jgi:hypothetical protein